MTGFTRTEPLHAAEFCLKYDTQCLDNITLTGSAALAAGTVLGKRTAVTAVLAKISGTGVAAYADVVVTLGALAEVGVYRLTCTRAADTGVLAQFQVATPNGELLPPITCTTAYAGGHLNLTLPVGTTVWVVGDVLGITVAGDGLYAQYNQDAVTGLQIPAGILLDAADASTADVQAVAFVRDGEVIGRLLTWPADITDAEKAAAIIHLEQRGIVVR
jgi:hypothetical protein